MSGRAVLVDFYHLSATPLERALPQICEKVLAGGEKLLIVGEEGVLDLIRTKMDEATADINEAVKRLDANAAAEDLFDANAFRRKVETELLADIERGTVDERAAAARVRRELEALVARTRPDAPPPPHARPMGAPLEEASRDTGCESRSHSDQADRQTQERKVPLPRFGEQPHRIAIDLLVVGDVRVEN